jgi:hypothetical protein
MPYFIKSKKRNDKMETTNSYFKNYKKVDDIEVDKEMLYRCFYSYEFVVDNKKVTAVSSEHIYARDILNGDIEKGRLELGKQTLIGYEEAFSSNNIKVYKKA